MVDPQAQKYRITFKCHDFDCGHEFVKVTTNINLQNPRCPECKAKKDQMRLNRIGDGAVSNSDLESVPRETGLRYIYRCKSDNCHTTFSLPQSDEFIAKPFCPKCGQNDVTFRKTNAPGVLTEESRHKNKAVDSTADIIMQDYKMTDLRDDARLGETSTPKLPPAMQAQADNFFSPQKNKNIPFNAGQLKRAALRGSYSNNKADMGAIVRSDNRPKIEVIHKD